MQRRTFITLLGGAAATWPLVARAQQPDRMRRLGMLMNRAADDPRGQVELAAFQQALQQLGWSDGRNIRIDTRWGENNVDRDRGYAAELVALAPDLHISQRHTERGSVATCHPHSADRVRAGFRSGRRGYRR